MTPFASKVLLVFLVGVELASSVLAQRRVRENIIQPEYLHNYLRKKTNILRMQLTSENFKPKGEIRKNDGSLSIAYSANKQEITFTIEPIDGDTIITYIKVVTDRNDEVAGIGTSKVIKEVDYERPHRLLLGFGFRDEKDDDLGRHHMSKGSLQDENIISCRYWLSGEFESVIEFQADELPFQ